MTETTAYYTCCDPADPCACMSMRTNYNFLCDWLALFPDGLEEVDEDSFIRCLVVGTGLGCGVIRTNLYIADQLKRMPRLCEFALTMRHLDRARLVAIEHACVSVKDELLPLVEEEIIRLLTPTKPRQMLITARTITEKIKEIITQIDPPAAERSAYESEEQLDMSHQPDGISTLTCTFRADEGHEVHTILKSVAAREHCTQAQALLQLIRQQTTATVVLNLYAPQDNHQPVNFGGTHTLDATAAAEWLDRVTRTRDIDCYANAHTPAYRIPEAMKAFVKGRDGGCRFPGCGARAEVCDIDHVVPYDQGGATAPANLQCLCRHCHNLKTDGMATATISKDATVTWTMHDGSTVTTTPQGPIAPTIKHRDSRWAVSIAERRKRRINRAA